LLALSGVSRSAAIDFDGTTGNYGYATTSACPTIAKPRPYETWFNVSDMETRGFWDPKNQTAWDFSYKVAQVICGAEQGSKIRLGMYFVRALGTMPTSTNLSSGLDENLGDRPETDPEIIYRALEYVKTQRGVDIQIVLDGGVITPSSAKTLINARLKRLTTNSNGIYWCRFGCFNVNADSTYPYAINHEKFLTISNTVWDKDSSTDTAVLSTSGNFARSQVRNYVQEASLVYNDQKLYEAFYYRFDGMRKCALSPRDCSGFDGLSLSKDRGIWVDNFYRHYTDSGRGTTVSFSPASSTARDYYVQQFDDVDCSVDKKIRVAMFKLTDSKAEQMVTSLKRLKSRGCDIKLLLTKQGGATTISSTVVSMLKDANIPVRCTAVPMHTKMILIGPATSNAGRVLYGTANMSTSGLRYSEEHIVTLDTRRASATYRDDARRVYGEYMSFWYELSQSTQSCT